MIPASMINKSLDGMEPFHKSDTWFTVRTYMRQTIAMISHIV